MMERICFDVVYGEKPHFEYEPWIIDNEMDFAAFEHWFYEAVKSGKTFTVFPFMIESDKSDS